MRSIKELKDLYNKGHIILNPQVLDRFKHYISEQRVFEALGQPRNIEIEQKSKFMQMYSSTYTAKTMVSRKTNKVGDNLVDPLGKSIDYHAEDIFMDG